MPGQKEEDLKRLDKWNKSVKGPIDGMTDYYTPPPNPVREVDESDKQEQQEKTVVKEKDTSDEFPF